MASAAPSPKGARHYTKSAYPVLPREAWVCGGEGALSFRWTSGTGFFSLVYVLNAVASRLQQTPCGYVFLKSWNHLKSRLVNMNPHRIVTSGKEPYLNMCTHVGVGTQYWWVSLLVSL